MRDGKRKDALTDLVDTIGSTSESQESNNGTVSTPSGEKVELGFDKRIQHLAKKLVKNIELLKKQEREVMEHQIRRQHEK